MVLQVKILTGDNDLISRKVCRDVGLLADPMLLGDEVEKMSDAELAEAAEKTHSSPASLPRTSSESFASCAAKVTLWDSWRRDQRFSRAACRGHWHLSGYGGRHRQRIRRSDSVAEGPDGAPGGGIEGRKVFANILKYIRMGASSNFGNMFSVLGQAPFCIPSHGPIQI